MPAERGFPSARWRGVPAWRHRRYERRLRVSSRLGVDFCLELARDFRREVTRLHVWCPGSAPMAQN